MFPSSSNALEESQESQRAFFFFQLGFLTKGMGPDCCVLALFTFSSQSLLVVQAWYKTLHVEIIFRLAAGSIMSAILKI